MSSLLDDFIPGGFHTWKISYVEDSYMKNFIPEGFHTLMISYLDDFISG